MSKKNKNEIFIEKALKKHGDKYDYSKVNYVDKLTKVCIICPKHGEFWQRPCEHLKGRGCRKCSDEKRALEMKMTTEEFIERAKKIHGDKYDYSKVEYVNNYTKVCIICPKHGEFNILPYAHLNLKEGCAKCVGQYKDTNLFITQAKKVHGDKYDYSKVEYINAFIKVCIICPKHGEFWQRPSSHLNGCGCKKCASEVLKKKCSLSKETFIEKARRVHGDKYDYSKVEYVNNRTKICIICPKHGEFWQTPNGHINNLQGCSKCKKSRMEEYTKLLLERNNIPYEDEKSFEWLIYNNNMKLDFLCGNKAIECQGGQHFLPIKKYGGDEQLNIRIKRDKLKYEQCKKNGIEIIYIIPYRYRNTELFKNFYLNKNYVFFKNIDDELIEKIKTL